MKAITKVCDKHERRQESENKIDDTMRDQILKQINTNILNNSTGTQQ